MMQEDKPRQILSDITVHMKYARFVPEKGRRETWNEIVERNMQMHIKKFPQLEEQIRSNYKFVFDRKVLPSMRSLQFGGKPIEVNPARLYNCCFLPIDNTDAFSETMFLLLGGTGVGYSVQKHHIEKLPEIKGVNPKRTRRYLIGDSIEGWADAIKVLIEAYFKGKSDIKFDFSDIRPKGATLVTAGGKAPGPQPLKDCIHNIRKILDSKEINSQLTPLEAHDIQCHIADAVLSGGIRRAALISLFSADDMDMISCKSGNWWELNPQRGRANNSAVLLRSKIDKIFFLSLWDRIKASGAGEPGIYFTNDKDWGTNPCCFVSDTIVAVADGRNGVSIKELAKSNQEFLVYSAKQSFVSNKFGKTNKFKKWKPEIKKAIAFKNGTKQVIEVILSDGSSFKCTPDHLLALPNNEWVEAKDSLGLKLEKFYSFSNKNNEKSYRHINSKTNGFSKQYRMIWEYYNGSYDGNFYNIDHINDDSKSDNIENLQLLSILDHKSKTKRFGLDNPIHRVSSKEYLSAYSKRSNIIANGAKYKWSEEVIEEKLAEFDLKYGEYISGLKPNDINVDFSQDVFVEEIKDCGLEDVYDLTVEDNHNFYIITKTDDVNFLNSSGVLVHNCEIALRPFQFCNLVEVNGSDISSQEDLNNRVKAAAFIGTLQASYTDFHYLRSIWKKTTEKEALLGVSMTGIASNEVFKYDQIEAAEVVKSENERVAQLLEINKAARTTCVKPAGTTSLVLGTSSGIHAWHSDYYLRRIRVNKNESIYPYLQIVAPEILDDELFNPQNTAVIQVPQKAPNGATTRNESVFDLLERVKAVSDTWIKAGHRSGVNTHNVSATISIKENDWESVGNWMWENRECYNGLSVLPFDGGTYQQAPFEDISEQEYNELVSKLHSIDLSLVSEIDDNTQLSDQAACAGGACEI